MVFTRAMHLSRPHLDTSGPEHGLSYDPSFLPSLPILVARPAPYTPVRAITAAEFAEIHLRAQTTHAPDSSIFPFLHGLEGDNIAQNTFFAADATDGQGRLRLPRFRGLIWVAADEGDSDHSDDDDDEPLSSDDESSEYSDEFDPATHCAAPTEDTFGMHMDVDADAEPLTATDPNSLPHMHPVAHRPPFRPSPSGATVIATKVHATTHGPTDILDFAFPPQAHPHDRRPSNASSTSSLSNSTSSLFDAASVSSASTPPASPAARGSKLPSTHQHHAHSPARHHPRPRKMPLFTSSFKPREILKPGPAGTLEPAFIDAIVPPGISLRNFGIQVPVYATISDIVVYSTRADGSGARSALAIAQLLKRAIESKAAERERRGCVCSGVAYNVFVLAANADEVQQHLSHLLQRVSPDAVADKDGMPAVRGLDGVSETRLSAHAGGLGLAVEPKEEAKEPASASTRPHAPTLLRANTISFAMREKEEMRELTRASEILSIFSPSTPGGADAAAAECSATTTATHWDPTVGQLFLGNAGDVPCEDTTPVPEAARSPACIARPGARPAPPKAQRSSSIGDGFDHGVNDPAEGRGFDICVECHDMAPFPSSAHLRAAEQHIRLLDAHWADKIRRGGVSETELAQHPRPPPPPAAVVHLPFPSSPPNTSVSVGAILTFLGFLERMLAPVAEPPATNLISAPAGSRTASPVPPRSRPLKILLHSADGYTESSVLALCTLMALRGLALPEAYLALQVEKRRSFFVYQADLHLLRKVEARVRGAGATAPGTRRGSVGWEHQPSAYYSPTRMLMEPSSLGRAAGGRLDAMGPASAGAVPNPSALMPTTLPGRRPRASTSPLPSVFGDHQAWFSDPRFDGSFPSRVLPFLYLGNLNHASNAYMLHALGITHVVSVGECALVPPSNAERTAGAPVSTSAPGCGVNGLRQTPGSLWLEEREGRIQVLDIQGVCDDGIDTLEPQLGPACAWIERARQQGGTVLVHCRVGVSRSATVVIAYVMQHLALSLVDAYLVVRSRRLSVLIQPNMRLLYNLLGWEIKLARDRAQGDEHKLKEELSRSLNWPYLAKEVHALNEKYLL